MIMMVLFMLCLSYLAVTTGYSTKLVNVFIRAFNWAMRPILLQRARYFPGIRFLSFDTLKIPAYNSIHRELRGTCFQFSVVWLSGNKSTYHRKFATKNERNVLAEIDSTRNWLNLKVMIVCDRGSVWSVWCDQILTETFSYILSGSFAFSMKFDWKRRWSLL